jgi:hypothetical protein
MMNIVNKKFQKSVLKCHSNATKNRILARFENLQKVN